MFANPQVFMGINRQTPTSVKGFGQTEDHDDSLFNNSVLYNKLRHLIFKACIITFPYALQFMPLVITSTRLIKINYIFD